MSWFKKRQPKPSLLEQANALLKENPPQRRKHEELQAMARQIGIEQWDAPYPADNLYLLMIGELQLQIDELKKENA